jgi:uncharacterized 2Fe-2S/4Fe-4S cluster protein (DUF4445 family)
MAEQVKITVEPDNKAGLFPKGTTLYKALYTLGIPMNASCGGFGKCGKCIVRILKDASPPGDSEKRFISDSMLRQGFRLACQTKVMKDTKVFVPPETRRRVSQTIYGKGRTVTIDPFVKKRYLKLSPASIHKNVTYFDMVKRAIGEKFYPSLDVLRETSRIPLEATYVTYGDAIIRVEEKDSTSMSYGVAIDIGTATITALLVDLLSGDVLSRGFSVNPQAAFGEDVISRITNALNRYGLRDLQMSVRGGVNSLIKKVVENSGVEKRYIYEIIFVGNTCMHHLFLGIPPNSLAVSPYIPLVKESLSMKARDIGIDLPTYARCYVFPNIAGFVGGDTIGAILSSGMLRSKKVILLIDIGTNGEVVLGSKERACTVSCAAGPAFEGVNLSCGMPASRGAIEGVDIEDGNVKFKVIGGGKPEGLCGSGLIDTLAQLLRMKIIDKTGRLKGKDKIISKKEGLAFPLTENIYISQKDIRQLQLAKAALRAGIEILKKHMNIRDEEIYEVQIAGAFGNFVRKESLTEIGIVPKVLSDRVHFIGNAALEGARLALLSKKMRREAENIPRRVEYLELMARKDFQEEFLTAITFSLL